MHHLDFGTRWANLFLCRLIGTPQKLHILEDFLVSYFGDGRTRLTNLTLGMGIMVTIGREACGIDAADPASLENVQSFEIFPCLTVVTAVHTLLTANESLIVDWCSCHVWTDVEFWFL